MATRVCLLFLLFGPCASMAVDDDCAAAAEASSVLLLQTSAGLQRHGAVQPAEMLDMQSSPSERLDAAWPLIWLHVPKTGSSFLNTLVRLPDVCPEGAELLGDQSFVEFDTNEDLQFMGNTTCPGLTGSIGGHVQVGLTFDGGDYDGHGVTMLRQPEQRVISGFLHLPSVMERANAIHGLAPFRGWHPVDGCTTRMLVDEVPDNFGRSDAATACWGRIDSSQVEQPRALSVADVEEAQARLRRFAFVGIQEEWHLSICLIHAMFGGECSAVEFENTRQGQQAESVFAAPEPYDTSVLDGWVDESDRAVYGTGLEIFHALCSAHGVTMDSCLPCFRSAGLAS